MGMGEKRSGLLFAASAVILAVLASGRVSAEGSQYFRVVQKDGKWWFVAPDGSKFMSMGVNAILPGGEKSVTPGSPVYEGAKKRGGVAKWARLSAKRLREWKFNTVGAWSAREVEKQGLPYCAYLWLGVGESNRLVDVWDPKYAEKVAEETGKQMAERDANDSMLIGWFIDNELPWYGEWGWETGGKPLLDLYGKLPKGSPGRQKADDYLKKLSPWPAAPLTEEQMKRMRQDIDGFAGEVAKKFMDLTVGAIRARDPHHLILGTRIAGNAPDEVVRAVGEASDVFSINWYVKNGRPDPNHLDRLCLLAGGKPVLITEYSYRAMENRSGDKNTRGAEVTVATQAERVTRFNRYVGTLAQLPQVVGFHWFCWYDEPPGGRFDGEDSNYGVVDIGDEPYLELVGAMKAMNKRVVKIHGGSAWKLPVKGEAARPRPLLPVVGMDVLPKMGRHPFPEFVYLDYATMPVRGDAWGDEASRCGGIFLKRGSAGVFNFSSGPGWGCGVNLNRGQPGPVDVAGASKVVLRMTAPDGLRFRIVLAEDGVAPSSATSFAGARNADGEQHVSPEIAGKAGKADYSVGLAEFDASGGYGNPAGNGRLDAQAVGGLALHVMGGQGKGEIHVFKVVFR